MSLIRIERVEDQVLPLAAEWDLGVVVNFPTANGILTGDIGISIYLVPISRLLIKGHCFFYSVKPLPI